MLQETKATKETNGIRLVKGEFVCMSCFYENHDESEKDRQHNPLSPVTCLDCEEYCISPLGRL